MPAIDNDVDPATAAADARAARWDLVLPHADRLRRIAARRLSCSDEVDDVVQEALLRAATFERLDEAYVGQFLTSVTVRLCTDVQRDRTRQLRVGVRDAVRSVEPCDPHETLLDNAEARWLYDECLKLPVRERAVVLARARGLSVREAAATLGVGVKSAEAAFTSARHRMRRAVQSAGVAAFASFRRTKRVTAPAALTTSMTVLVAGTVFTAIVPERDGTSESAEPRVVALHATDRPVVRHRAARATRSAIAGVTGAGVGAAALVLTEGPAPRPAAPIVQNPANLPRTRPPQTWVRTDGHGAAPVKTKTGGEVDDEEETFQESLERCLREGPALGPNNFGCRPKGEAVGSRGGLS
jgi:RNA polymerase sigma-70 factor (ECF subfamily)